MTILAQISGNRTQSAAALTRIRSRFGEPLFIGDWDRTLMLHLEVAPAALQRAVPFELDLHHGRAFVTLVAFTLRGMRFAFGGKPGAWLMRPISTHHFLNVRTYVRHGDETGIHFLAEWLSNPLAVQLGPPAFGLPYHFGRLNYRHEWEHGKICGSVADTECRGELVYETTADALNNFTPCEGGSLDEWLMERYTAFTYRRGRALFFRVWHEPWPQAPVNASISRMNLLTDRWPWLHGSELIGANFSPGVRDVWMGRPHRLPTL